MTEQAAAKDRMKEIITSTAAQGREELASFLAYDTELSAADAIATLAAAPIKAAPAEPRAPTLFEEMASYKKPRISSDGGLRPNQLSPEQQGAASAKKLLGK
ncbi:MAG: hypothetical protein WDN46_24160 [Methylocella sp.]